MERVELVLVIAAAHVVAVCALMSPYFIGLGMSSQYMGRRVGGTAHKAC